MKSKFLSVFLCILCLAFCLSGCGMGNYLDNGKKGTSSDGNGSGNDPGNDPGDTIASSNYTVTVYYNNRPFAPGDLEITAVWRGKNDVVRVLLDDKGRADAGVLNGTYSVYLDGLPQEYTYDPNGYTATTEEKQVSIPLSSVRSPDSGDGSDLYVGNGCYSTRDEGIYRTVIPREGKTLFYEFKPISDGVFSIKSLVNIYDDEINPYIDVYTGIASKTFSHRLDTGGAAMDGGFCKNFCYYFSVASNEVGNVCTFAVGGVSKSGEYPLYVDFEIRWVDSYSSEYSDIRPQAAKEARGKTAEPTEGQTFVYADMGTKLFDASKFRFNPDTGRYHVYDAKTGFGAMLLCDLKGALPSYKVISSLYDANKVGPNESNYLLLYNMWIEEEQKFAAFDYTNFIRVDYARVCNSDGKCYVTEELRAFLQKFAENHSLYTDGVSAGEGTPEYMGYSANQDALWLFACGFYQ